MAKIGDIVKNKPPVVQPKKAGADKAPAKKATRQKKTAKG